MPNFEKKLRAKGVRLPRRSLLSCLLLAACSKAIEPPNAPFQMAILGDSLSTGAASHPALAMDAKQLWDVFQERIDVQARDASGAQLPAPQRLWPSMREFFGGADWVYRNLMQAVSRRFLDTEEYSWGYQVARAHLPGDASAQAQAVAIAAEDGAKTEAIPLQLERVLEASGGRLPPKVFVFFTGNDLCGMIFSQVTSEADYRRDLRTGLASMLRAEPAPGGTDIYVLGYLSVLQLVHGESILAKPVRAYGEATTCGELRAGGFRPKDPNYQPDLPEEAKWFGVFMPPNPAAYCSTLFSPPGKGSDELVGSLANRIRAYREIQRQVVDEFSGKPSTPNAVPTVVAPAGMRLHYLSETAELSFVAEDIADDCFHLSQAGQAKVAQAVVSYLNRVDMPR